MYDKTGIMTTTEIPTVGDAAHAVENKADKIYCANCKHCKLVCSSTGSNDQYQLRVRCDAGKWKKKLGDEKYYKYFTVARRSTEVCDMYEPMGDTKTFLKELKKTLPIKDEVYMYS